MTPRRAFPLALAAFFLLAAAWASALPPNGTYDEKHHIIRAYAVASGQLLPVGRTPDELGLGEEAFRVPRSLLPANPHCTWYPQRLPASCQQATTGGGTELVASGAARYSPVYYLPVGLPMLARPDAIGILLGRLVSALMSALLLAAAVWIGARLGNRLLIAAVALAATPTVVNLAGAINPNGLEIAAGVLLFAALLALLRAEPEPPPQMRRPLLIFAGVAAALLLTVRHLGPLLLAVDVAAVAALARPGRLGTLAARRETRAILGGLAGAGLVMAVGWALFASTADVAATPRRALSLSTGELIRELVTFRVPFYVKQLIGQFGYGETTISPLAIAGWYALLAVVVVPAMWRGRRLRWVAAALVLGCAALLIGLELYFVRTSGWFSHGRYVLPVLVGVVLAAAFEPSALGAPAGRARDPRTLLPAVLVAASLPLHAYALARVMTRYQVGIGAGLNPLGGSWHPPLGSVLPLLACLTGGLLLVLAVAGAPTAVADGEESSTGYRASTLNANTQ